MKFNKEILHFSSSQNSIMRSFFKYIVTIFLLLLILGACTSKEDTPKYKIGFAQAMTTDNWRRDMNKSMQVEASMHPELELEIKDAGNNVQKQIEQIEGFIEENVDVLIVSPIESVPITPAIDKAMDAGIPTIIIDRKIEGSNYTAYLGADNFQIGANAARYIISGEESGAEIYEITGAPGSSPAHERSRGFKSIIDSTDNFKIIHSIRGDWEKSSITEELAGLLEKKEIPDFIFAHNDRMALGAWEVAKEYSLENELKIIGVDGLFGPSGGIQLVKEGILYATILYPTGGAEAIKLAEHILDGESVSKNNILRTVVIDSVNVGIMQNQFDKINQQQNDIARQQQTIKEQIATYNSQSNLVKIMIALAAVLFFLMLWSIYLLYKNKKSKKRLELNNRKIIVQRNQIENFAKKLKESNESKINFFTALSHEFKTPLTLITSSIENIAGGSSGSLKAFDYETKLIINNSKRLLRLINELLDFRKLEGNSFRLKPVKTNLHEFLENIYSDFKSEALRKSITLEFTSNVESPLAYIDRDMMDKVFFNLLSNALRFTPKNGQITLTLSETDKFFEIIIKDSGIGIPKEEFERIFDPFTQAANNSKVSSGLGLFITKQFVELHKGQISVTSRQGAEFKVVLRKGKQHLAQYEVSDKNLPVQINHSEIFDKAEVAEISEISANFKENENKENILIIEDNHDLSLLLYKKFSPTYGVILSDGTNGIEKALEFIPDVILCDLNLPQKSGFEICRELKNDLRTSHIPTIILTALSDEESRLKALKSGADLYITKPFSFEVLEQSVISMLYNREKLRYYYTNKIDEVKDEEFNPSEQNFLKDLNAIIEKNIAQPNFTVEDLARQLNISRVQLYRKVKAILGISISDYINSQKLARAKNLLQESNLNISEIAYQLGYSSPGYFSTSFKNKYGISPKQLRS